MFTPDAALAGAGDVRSLFIAHHVVAKGEPIAELAHDRWVVTHQNDRHLPEVRRVVDRLYDLFANEVAAPARHQMPHTSPSRSTTPGFCSQQEGN